jgi:tRNA (adenine-N(1)-)-methyltransferase non-catalytic subunit
MNSYNLNPAARRYSRALEELRSTHTAVNLSLHEPWLRQHQVLPGRTHPTMTTQAGAGGYVLSGNYMPPWARSGKRGGGGADEGENGGGGRGGGGGAKRARAD